MCYVIQVDNHQENLVLSDAKKLDADGLVNFITINEIRFITEYSQVVGVTRVLITITLIFSAFVCQTAICFWSFIPESFTSFI